MNLNELIDAEYYASQVIQAVDLRDLVLKSISSEDYYEALSAALLPMCSTKLSMYSREPLDKHEEESVSYAPKPRSGNKTPPDRTRNSASIDSRPFSISRGVRVAFKDMTEDNWNSYIEFRYRRIEGLRSTATWAKSVIARMHEYGVLTSGELPHSAKEKLFTNIRPELEED